MILHHLILHHLILHHFILHNLIQEPSKSAAGVPESSEGTEQEEKLERPTKKRASSGSSDTQAKKIVNKEKSPLEKKPG